MQDTVGAGAPPAVARLVYASQAAIAGPVYGEMERIRAAAVRHNAPAGIHTALLYQSGWFVQWKEGPGEALQALMARVAADPRHHSMRVVHASRGPRLLSGPWSMAIVQAADPPADMTARILRLRRSMLDGRQFAPPAVWRQISTPLANAGAPLQAEPDAFRRILVCAAAGQGSFALVQWLAHRSGQAVVHRRFAGAQALDVGTDLVDFACPEAGMLRVIAMARNGLALPLTRAFLPDYSHLLLLLAGDAQRDAALVRRVGAACGGLAAPPVLVAVAAGAAAHAVPCGEARRAGLVYLDVAADPACPEAAWEAARGLICRKPATDGQA